MTITAPLRHRIFSAVLQFFSDGVAALKQYFPEQEAVSETPELEEVLSEKPPRPLRHTLHFVAALFVTLVAIASFNSVDIIVVATGRLVPDSPPIVIQPMSLAIIREIRVKPGDVVRKGDVVATLDPTFTEADRATLSAQMSSVSAQTARLEAELSGQPLRFESKGADNAIQTTLYLQRSSQYQARLKEFDEDIEHLKTAMLSAEQHNDSLQQETDIAREVESMRAKLLTLQVGSKLSLLDSRVMRMRVEREHSDSLDHLNELRHMLSARQDERQVFVDKWRRNLLEDLLRARKESAGIVESLVKADRMNDLSVLTAPLDGIVLDVAKRSVGSVMQSAETLVTLVPVDAPLIAEVAINSSDVGYTAVGNEVALKIDAFPYQRHGMIRGWLKTIAEDSISGGAATSGSNPSPGGSGLYHRSRVELTETTLRALPQGARLIPGMSVTAEIKAGRRTAITYFLYPILRGFNESLREP
jgi:HlyD family secretion protein